MLSHKQTHFIGGSLLRPNGIQFSALGQVLGIRELFRWQVTAAQICRQVVCRGLYPLTARQLPPNK